MSPSLRRIAVRLALCGLIGWLGIKISQRLDMPAGLGFVWVAPMFGAALARPLLDLASDIRHGMRWAKWQPVEGRHYVFRQEPVSVSEDADCQRWVRLADVRRVIGFSASDAALQVTYPSGFRRIGKGREAHLSDEALLAHLAKERAPIALKFRHWAEREIVFPARRERERRGIRLASLDFRASDG